MKFGSVREKKGRMEGWEIRRIIEAKGVIEEQREKQGGLRNPKTVTRLQKILRG